MGYQKITLVGFLAGLMFGLIVAFPGAASAQSFPLKPSPIFSTLASFSSASSTSASSTTTHIFPNVTWPPLFPAQAPASGASPNQNGLARNSYTPITGKQRLLWFVKFSAGPQSLAAGVFSAAIGTGLDRPKEYGPHWNGFGSRYGMRLTGGVTGNAMEASLGAIWGEDPRYSRATGQPLGGRVKHFILMTFVARRRDGDLEPAYARYVATAGNNFLSNTWREPSESTTGAALERTALGFAGRMGSNAFQEFWPDVVQHVFHRSL